MRYRKSHHDHFTVSFTIGVRELINRRDVSGLLQIFREPDFQFAALPYDEAAQIGVLIGLHFRSFNDQELEEILLLEPNFRDIVFKIFVDYSNLNGKYGSWIQFLSKQKIRDVETRTFLNCLEVWRLYLMQAPLKLKVVNAIPKLDVSQHPILFGRIFGMKLHLEKNEAIKDDLVFQFKERLRSQPQYITEFFYEPCIQSLILQNPTLKKIIHDHVHLVNDIKFWYHISQVSIHRVFQVSILIEQGQYLKASAILEHIPFGHIIHGYREIIELYISFFRLKIVEEIGGFHSSLLEEFEKNRKKLNYPIFTDTYFRDYFSATRS
jgi:hypothetical protein